MSLAVTVGVMNHDHLANDILEKAPKSYYIISHYVMLITGKLCTL